MGIALVGTSTSSSAAWLSARGGAISRSEVIARAQYWVDHSPNYNMGGAANGPTGEPYRTDCSGYVSMALHLSGSETSSSLPGVGYEIPRSDLRPGDFLSQPGQPGHAILFDQWVDAGHSAFWYYSFGSTPAKHVLTSATATNIDSRSNSAYKAYRYRNIVEADGGAPVVVPTAALAYNAPAAIIDAADRISLYAIRSDGNLWGASQAAAGAGLGAWQTLGAGAGTLVGRPSVVRLSNGIIAAYARTSGGLVVGTNQTAVGGSFAPWTTIGTAGAGVTGDPVAVQLASGIIAVYATTQSGTVSGVAQTAPGGAFGSWTTIGSSSLRLFGRPAVVRFSNDRIGLFVEGGDGYIYGTEQPAPGSVFNAWSRLGVAGAGVTTEPVAVLDHDRVTVFAGAASTAVASVTQSAPGVAFGSWVNLGSGPTPVGIATPAVIPSPNLYSAYAPGTDGTVWGTSVPTTPRASSWAQIGSGGPIVTALSGIRTSTGINCVYGANSDGVIAGSCQTSPGGPFSTWASL
ncbi:hypothetical protein Cch01nite_41260 [Cellulomonas chitinilytica]|uniref:PLL-like beta propeller domain-containing protein n=2 Tax=Cellulomonas chitinilytica TaxID=398759 RepID=A0A919P778_9CELL|nr:hypothetical protein Cch01nite_41260 [Cellulomonas chitinilytica]